MARVWRHRHRSCRHWRATSSHCRGPRTSHEPQAPDAREDASPAPPRCRRASAPSARGPPEPIRAPIAREGADMDTIDTITARIVTDSRPRSCAYCDGTRSRHHLRAVDIFTADGTEWVCYFCAASRSPLLVVAVDAYEHELDRLADDRSVSVGRARAIRDETVALLTDGRDPRRSRIVVGTESDIVPLERAARRVAARRGTPAAA